MRTCGSAAYLTLKDMGLLHQRTVSKVPMSPLMSRLRCARRRHDCQDLVTFKLSSDPMFVEKVRDIVGLYLREPIAP